MSELKQMLASEVIDVDNILEKVVFKLQHGGFKIAKLQQSKWLTSGLGNGPGQIQIQGHGLSSTQQLNRSNNNNHMIMTTSANNTFESNTVSMNHSTPSNSVAQHQCQSSVPQGNPVSSSTNLLQICHSVKHTLKLMHQAEILQEIETEGGLLNYRLIVDADILNYNYEEF
eukprot:CAMPEP_0116892452 /NCGR_PEP_ID=MMETSP0467-20121206/2669_1 /TAXON_ID=283647 /ORGANISM="Mesodinium pulex, Strain SPMC105" /LENGTH=170 /DNA_ID=CAMNT_0004561583 /DNA_START=1176 /DNA_END=1688 /DNA_ORIENTATION=+